MLRDVKLVLKLKIVKPVTVNCQLPTIDDARIIISHQFTFASEDWKRTAPKNAVSRYYLFLQLGSINQLHYHCNNFSYLSLNEKVLRKQN